MPLRDHFHPPFSQTNRWDGFHGQFPAMVVLALKKILPVGYSAQPTVRLGTGIEVDVGSFRYESSPIGAVRSSGGGGLALLSPPAPTFSVSTELPTADEYEVLVYDTERERRLVAAIEIVSPSNKDRPEHRREFVAKCASLLRQNVSVSIVDLVTERRFNLYLDLLDFFGQSDPQFASPGPPLYAATCAGRQDKARWSLKTWAYTLEIGQPLPTLPIILSHWDCVNLDLEPVYEATLEAIS